MSADAPDNQNAERMRARWTWVEAVALDKRTAGIPMRVVVIISSMIGEQGFAWPGREAIAVIAGSDRTNIKDALKKLEQLGYLRIEVNPKRGPKCVDRFWPTGIPDTSPVWARYRDWKAQGGSVDPSYSDEEAAAARGVSEPIRGVSGLDEGGVETPRLLEETPGKKTPCSEPNGSASAVASAKLFSWIDGDTWVRVVRHWQASGEWSETYGPSPEDPACELPQDIADRMGVSLTMAEVSQ